MDEFVEALAARGLLTPEAARRVRELEDRTHLPLAREIHALLYVGAALILAGVGATVKDHLDQVGPATILAVLGLAAAACFAYCFQQGRPFAPGRVEAPGAAYDYVLYLGCGLVGIFFTYLEYKWKVLGSWRDLYLFGSGLAFAALAYRFDNRLVLAAGLMNLAVWLGMNLSRWHMGADSARLAIAAYGAVLFAAGASIRRSPLKPHFADTYLTLGVHIGLLALLADPKLESPWLWALLAVCAALGAWSMRERRFDTFAAATAYAYAGLLIGVLRLSSFSGTDEVLWIVILSATAVLAAVLWARARFKEAAS